MTFWEIGSNCNATCKYAGFLEVTKSQVLVILQRSVFDLLLPFIIEENSIFQVEVSKHKHPLFSHSRMWVSWIQSTDPLGSVGSIFKYKLAIACQIVQTMSISKTRCPNRPKINNYIVGFFTIKQNNGPTIKLEPLNKTCTLYHFNNQQFNDWVFILKILAKMCHQLLWQLSEIDLIKIWCLTFFDKGIRWINIQSIKNFLVTSTQKI